MKTVTWLLIFSSADFFQNQGVKKLFSLDINVHILKIVYCLEYTMNENYMFPYQRDPQPISMFSE